MSRDGDVMALVPFEGVGIFDAVNFLIRITYNYRLFTGSDALLGASRSSSIGRPKPQVPGNCINAALPLQALRTSYSSMELAMHWQVTGHLPTEIGGTISQPCHQA